MGKMYEIKYLDTRYTYTFQKTYWILIFDHKILDNIDIVSKIQNMKDFNTIYFQKCGINLIKVFRKFHKFFIYIQYIYAKFK